VLLLVVRLGEDRYAINARQVAEVLPLVGIRRTVRSQPGLIGTFNYHGAFIPVIDLSELTMGRPAPPRLSTRIVVVRGSEKGEKPRLLGLIGENATETMRCEPADFVSPGIVSDEALFLGPIANGPRGLVQRIEVDTLVRKYAHEPAFEEPA
jgi:chemotaxis-related protein WspB